MYLGLCGFEIKYKIYISEIILTRYPRFCYARGVHPYRQLGTIEL
jgi:hypothetical protein